MVGSSNKRISLFCNNINYVTYIYEFHHLSRPDLPEYKGWSDFDFREELLETNIKKSLSLIVDTQKKGKDLELKKHNLYKGGARCKHKWFRKTLYN